MAGDRLQRLAGGADDQRQRDQRHHRPGGEERAAEDGVRPAAVKERKPKALCWKTSRPKIASTMLGVPATISTPDSTARASPAGRPYSVSQTAIPTPIGSGDRGAEDGQDEGALDRVEEAAASSTGRARPADG